MAERECGREEGAGPEVTFKSSKGDRGETAGGACLLGSYDFYSQKMKKKRRLYKCPAGDCGDLFWSA